MKSILKIGLCILLLVLTLCVIFIPQYISIQSEEKSLGKTEYRDYNIGLRPKLTRDIVARLYYDREIDIGYNFISGQNDNEGNIGNTEKIRESVLELADLIFGSDEIVCEHIKDIIRSGNILYYRNNSLVKINNRSTALHFITCRVKKDNTVLEFIYEDKTKTAISCSHNYHESEFNDIKNTDLYFESLSAAIKNYYENILQMQEDEYFYVADFILDKDKSPNNYIMAVYGLMQNPDKFFYKDSKEIYEIYESDTN